MAHKCAAKRKQFSFLFAKNYSDKGFGGSKFKGNPKVQRPVSSKHSLHVVLKSSVARGSLSMRQKRFKERIRSHVFSQAEKCGVRVYKYANVGSHLHLLIKPHSRRLLIKYFRIICGLIPRIVLDAEKGRSKGIRFWESRPYTRVISWGRPFEIVKAYLEKNQLEAIGFRSFSMENNKKIKVYFVD